MILLLFPLQFSLAYSLQLFWNRFTRLADCLMEKWFASFSFSSLGHIWAIFHVGLWLGSFVFQSIQVTIIEKLSIKGDLKNSSHLCLDLVLIHNLRKLTSVCLCIHGEIKTFRCIQEILLIGCNIHEVVYNPMFRVLISKSDNFFVMSN